MNELKDIYPLLETAIKEDDFELDPNTNAINVHIIIRPEVFAEYPSSYFTLPEADEYIKFNPKYKEGYDLAYAFKFNFMNVL